MRQPSSLPIQTLPLCKDLLTSSAPYSLYMAETEELPSATPRDARILHLILASAGVGAYEDRVPLQLMDFAHRYTAQVLEDSLVYADHARAGANPSTGTAANTALTVDDVRLAVQARVRHQFKPAPPKEMLLGLAHERNRRPLPPVPAAAASSATAPGIIRLPPEKYCLTGKDWALEEEAAELPDGDEEMDLDAGMGIEADIETDQRGVKRARE
ncbi:transcription initiation factor IID, 31kD subunit-domain-containing protein [Limtongia smithiae]|uniref:transcription initiation factor IID, 31kD subunit-domain-containing protein n=1 Tax=Limtongia smithiae TaxID=1125753 RepID=UPI0034CF1AFA